ncbi:MAG TPA: glycosyltransferase family 4 protein [Isosphaeraceae bacterium]|nr:glycosyltransferase family 4 protein [Isosphaeraceae bacterium]
MAGSVLKVLLLARQLPGYDGTWALTSLLDRLERRGCLPQIVFASRGMAPSDDRRAIEAPGLANRWLRPLAVRRLWTDSRVDRPDLIHAVDDSMANVALALAEFAETAYVQSVNSFSTLQTGLRLSRRWCRRIVAASDDLADNLVIELDVPAEMVTVILPGVIVPSPSAPVTGVKSVPVVGTTGSSQDVPGFTILLEAAKLVLDSGHEVEFVIATAESEHVFLRHRAQKLGIGERVTVSDDRIIGAMFWSVLDVYCQPSIGPSTGRTLLYALARGVPSIATDVKGLRSLIEPGQTALLIPPADPHAMRQAIVDLLAAPDDARRLGWQARESIRQRFDADVEADSLTALYREVMTRA